MYLYLSPLYAAEAARLTWVLCKVLNVWAIFLDTRNKHRSGYNIWELRPNMSQKVF